MLPACCTTRDKQRKYGSQPKPASQLPLFFAGVIGCPRLQQIFNCTRVVFLTDEGYAVDLRCWMISWNEAAAETRRFIWTWSKNVEWGWKQTTSVTGGAMRREQIYAYHRLYRLWKKLAPMLEVGT